MTSVCQVHESRLDQESSGGIKNHNALRQSGRNLKYSPVNEGKMICPSGDLKINFPDKFVLEK